MQHELMSTGLHLHVGERDELRLGDGLVCLPEHPLLEQDLRSTAPCQWGSYLDIQQNACAAMSCCGLVLQQTMQTNQATPAWRRSTRMAALPQQKRMTRAAQGQTLSQPQVTCQRGRALDCVSRDLRSRKSASTSAMYLLSSSRKCSSHGAWPSSGFSVCARTPCPWNACSVCGRLPIIDHNNHGPFQMLARSALLAWLQLERLPYTCASFCLRCAGSFTQWS